MVNYRFIVAKFLFYFYDDWVSDVRKFSLHFHLVSLLPYVFSSTFPTQYFEYCDGGWRAGKVKRRKSFFFSLALSMHRLSSSVEERRSLNRPGARAWFEPLWALPLFSDEMLMNRRIGHTSYSSVHYIVH